LRNDYQFPLGYCLNPDDIDRELALVGRFYLGGWGWLVEDAQLQAFVKSHALYPRLTGSIPRIDRSCLIADLPFERSYFTTIFCDFVRGRWMQSNESFLFETVFSGRDKLELMREGLKLGYRTYLYYICTEDVSINKNRIEIRVKRGGHSVEPARVDQRYKRSLALLPDAIRGSSRAYVFDNSSKDRRLIAEYESGKLVALADSLPAWFAETVLRQADLAG
jgi:hypothetical protein